MSHKRGTLDGSVDVKLTTGGTVGVPSGNQTWLAGKSPMEVFIGTSTISGGSYVAMFDYQRVCALKCIFTLT